MRILLLTLILGLSTLFANIGKISAIKGDVTLERNSQSIETKVGTLLEEQDNISTGNDGRLQIVFNDKTVISIGKNSKFDINEYFYDEEKVQDVKAKFSAVQGVFKTITGKIGKLNPSKFKLNTKSASIGIRGTIYFVEAKHGAAYSQSSDAGTETYSCTSGSIIVNDPATGESVEVKEGFQIVAIPGQPLPEPTPIPPAKAAQLEKTSGAEANEAESGENAQTVEQAKKETKPQTTEETSDEKKKEESTDNESSGDTNNDEATPVTTTDDTENTPPPPTTNTPTPVVADLPIDNVDEVVNTANEASTEETSDNFTSNYSSFNLPIFSGDAAAKSGTYNVFHLGYNSNNYYSFEYATGAVKQNLTYNLVDGKIAGSNTFYYQDSSGQAVDIDGITGNDYTTVTLDMTLPNPYSDYRGVGFYYEYDETGSISEDYFKYSYLSVFSDTKQEFFVVNKYTDKYSTLDTTSDSYGVYDYNTNQYVYYDNIYTTSDMLIIGQKSTYNSLANKTGVSLYLEPWEIQYRTWMNNNYYYVEDDDHEYTHLSSYNGTYLMEHSNYLSTINSYGSYYDYYYYYNDISSLGTYINWGNKNLLNYDLSIYPASYDNYLGSYSHIVIGKIGSDSNGDAKITVSEQNIGSSSSSADQLVNNDLYIFGSEQQGLGGTVTYQDSLNTWNEIVGEFRADGLASESSSISSGVLTLEGFASTHFSHAYSTNIGKTNSLSLTTDKQNSMIGIISCASTGLILSFNTSLGTDAAYITDNTLATLGISGSWTQTSGESFSNGWLVGIDTDLYSSSSNTATPGISWGAWGVESSSNSYDVDVDFWVAGVDRVQDIVNDLGSDFTGTYVGNIMGVLNNSSLLNTIESTISLDFDFGQGSIDATINAVTGYGTSKITTTVQDTFSGVDTSLGNIYNADTSINQTASTITGSFYDQGATTAGTITLEDASNIVSGVYKAAK